MLQILKKILSYVLVLIGLSILIFVIVRVIPGDVARLALGPRAPEETVQAYRVQMHLDKPIYVQYVYWVNGIFHGDFGTSTISKRPVLQDIQAYIPATIEVCIISTVVMLVFGLILGVIATKYANKWPDTIIKILSYIGIASPAFLWAVLAILVLCYMIPIFPIAGRLSVTFSPPPKVTGMYTIDFLIAGNVPGFWDALKHMILPGVISALGGISELARMTRSAMVENMNKPFAYAERAYGIPENKILFKYILKPSANSIITISAITIAAFFGGAYISEQIFNFPGLGRYALTAMLQKDLFAVSAVVMYTGIIVMLFNLLIDILIRAVDPRVKYNS